MEGRATGVPGTVRAILYLALLLPGACGRPAGARTAVVVPPQDTSAAFAGSMNAVRRARPGRHPAILRAVRLAPHAAYDRVVFEFAGDSAPGYEVEYADRPIRRCGSGDAVSLMGAGHLVVRFEPAQMHDERGNPTVARREWTPRPRAAKEIKRLGCLGGQVEGFRGPHPPRLSRFPETAAPPRVIIDLRHEP